MTDSVNPLRIQQLNDCAVNPHGEYVLYWMIANRRLTHNFALQRAVDLAMSLGKPLLILEALRCDYEWASIRFHRFVLQGMANNRADAGEARVSYYPYVEPHAGAGSGLLQALAEQACCVVTDDFPCFFLPRMVRGVGRRLSVSAEAVDSNGLYPMRATDRIFTKAFSFRNHLQKTLAPFLEQFPVASPLASRQLTKADCIPRSVVERWPPATDQLLAANSEPLASLPIDTSVGAATFDGGTHAAVQTLKRFLKNGLTRYADDRNQPDNDPSSGLSPYLHLGHISAHEVFQSIADHEGWTTDCLGDAKETKGSRNGWWGMSPYAEAFMDELVTWRELGYNACCHDSNYDSYESLPSFAQETLAKHAGDPRPYLYSYAQLRDAATHDDIWNAAQNQLVTEGRMHNYLRMLWGKKILEWSPSAQEALEVMIDLNNRYAVDGRNPNSYSGILWVLGKYDRAWGPERPIFGKVRYMTSDSTRRKLRLTDYLRRYSPGGQQSLFDD